MGPKPKTADERLQFILQCLHTLKDADGKVMLKTHHFKIVGALNGMKGNSAYVRYREIVNQQIENGVQGLEPVGTKAAEEVRRKRSASSTAGTQQTPASTPATTAAPTATSSPVKDSGKKRKRSTTKREDDDDEETYDRRPYVNDHPERRSAKSSRTTHASEVTPKKPTQTFQPDFPSSFLDFDHTADLLQIDERHHLDLGRSSDADAEGESDGGF